MPLASFLASGTFVIIVVCGLAIAILTKTGVFLATDSQIRVVFLTHGDQGVVLLILNTSKAQQLNI